MTGRKFKIKLAISGSLISIALVLSTVALVFSSPDSHLSSETFSYIFLFISLGFILIALHILLYPNYLPRGIIGYSLSLLPICKEKIKSAGSICARCLGFPLGIIVSACLAALVFRQRIWAEVLMHFNFWFLIALALLFNTPTAIHGYFRRLMVPTPLSGKAFRFSMGFLSGLGFFLAFLAFLRLLGVENIHPK